MQPLHSWVPVVETLAPRFLQTNVPTSAVPKVSTHSYSRIPSQSYHSLSTASPAPSTSLLFLLLFLALSCSCAGTCSTQKAQGSTPIHAAVTVSRRTRRGRLSGCFRSPTVRGAHALGA